jgi:Ca-activated chloride channel family protein
MNAQRIVGLTLLAFFIGLLPTFGVGTLPQAQGASSGEGSLTIMQPDGTLGHGCPLEHTSVKTEISGFVARVEVTQTFHNPRKEKIEAVYTFPLSADAAVDDMEMRVGERVVRGMIKRREDARRIYEDARTRGHVASLLDQERPNIFTQSVANIMPEEKVIITIKYAELLPYEDGAFTFVFPMVVGPRFIPGHATGKQGTGWAPGTSSVPDASRITPPVAPEGTRAGHDIDLAVTVEAGVPILGIDSKLHEVEIERRNKKRAVVTMKNKKEIPNRDFVLKYTVAGDEIRSGILTHKEGASGYATIILIPPKRVKPEQIAPKEMIFVIDCSGSQSGKPLEKARETMRYVVDNMNPDDTFNIIDFNSGARALFGTPRKNSPKNRAKALKYLGALQARGGTWMGPAIETVCKSPAPENRLRIVTFMTDGYVGNDFEIISLVKRLRGKSRWFPFGTGNSVNRFLLDNMAKAGGGEVAYILLKSPGKEVAKKFYERIASPVLTDISLDFTGVGLEEIYPQAVSDLWSRKPLIFRARYHKAGKGTLTIKGFAGGKPYEQHLNVKLPEKERANAAIASIWARAKVDDLMSRDWVGIQRNAPRNEVKEEIIQVALAHRIMTQFTSFVAVEETVVTVGGKPTRVTVPVEMPDGVSRKGVFGDNRPMESNGVLKQTQSSLSVARRKLPGGSTPLPAPEMRLPRNRESFDKNHAMKPTDETGLREQEARTEVLKDEEKSETHGSEKLKYHGEAKLSEELKNLMRAYKEGGSPSEFSVGPIRVVHGKITVQVLLARTTDLIIAKIKEAGLEIQFSATAGTTVIGTIPVEQLKDLALISEVNWVKAVEAS